MGRTISLVLAVAFFLTGAVFLCLSIFFRGVENWYLASALACIALANICNFVNAGMGRNKR